MYEQAFNFTQRPFSICPAPAEFYRGQSHQQAVEATRVCVERRNGPVVLIGSVGSGKSLTMQVIGEEHAQTFDVVSIECSRLEQRSELLQSILFGLGLPFREMSEGELRLSLIEHLKTGNGSNEGMLLLVDEADRLSIELLDELRLITNVVRDGRSQVQLVLAGTQRLEESLNDPRLASFNQRVASRNFLQNLSHAEVGDYISEHIARAGGTSGSVFDDCAIAEIARCTDGCPRLINQVCEKSLVEAAESSRSSIDQFVVQQAWAKLQNLPAPTSSQPSSDGSYGCASDSESVVEFGSLSDEQDFDSSCTVGCDENQENFDSFSADETDQVGELDSRDITYGSLEEQESEPNETHEAENEEAAEDEGAFSESNNDTTEEHSSVVEPIADDSSPADPEIESDPSNDWSGRLPTNLGINDFRMDFESQSTRYSMPPMTAGGDPFAPDSDDVELNRHGFQDSREIGNLGESTAFTYGQSYSGYSQASDGDASDGNDSEATDSRIEALRQEQQDLIDQVDSVTGEAESFDADESLNKADEDSSMTSGNEDDVQKAFEGLDQIDQARSAETSPSPVPTVEPAVDPFEEDFEEEVLLQDTYSPFVAKQNQSSLTVTSENLAHLQPNDEVVGEEESEVTSVVEQTDESEEQDDSQDHLPSGFSVPMSTADASFIPVQSVATEISSDDVEFSAEPIQDTSAEIVGDSINHDSGDHVEEIDPELAALTCDFPFEEQQPFSSGVDSLTTDANVSDGGYFTPQLSVTDQPDSQFGQDEADRVAQEIKEETEGIAQELRSTIESDVSRENGEPQSTETVQSWHEDQVAEDQQLPFVTTDVSTHDSGQSDSETPLNDNQQILRDIFEKQRLIQEQQQATATDSSAPNSNEVDSISVEYPITDHQNYQAPSDIGDDDRDMLRVSETEYSQPQKEAAEERSPLADATPSTGEAQRMDYGQLFNQLRNLPKE